MILDLIKIGYWKQVHYIDLHGQSRDFKNNVNREARARGKGENKNNCSHPHRSLKWT